VRAQTAPRLQGGLPDVHKLKAKGAQLLSGGLAQAGGFFGALAGGRDGAVAKDVLADLDLEGLEEGGAL
jgi:hypothetical protein